MAVSKGNNSSKHLSQGKVSRKVSPNTQVSKSKKKNLGKSRGSSKRGFFKMLRDNVVQQLQQDLAEANITSESEKRPESNAVRRTKSERSNKEVSGRDKHDSKRKKRQPSRPQSRSQGQTGMKKFKSDTGMLKSVKIIETRTKKKSTNERKSGGTSNLKSKKPNKQRNDSDLAKRDQHESQSDTKQQRPSPQGSEPRLKKFKEHPKLIANRKQNDRQKRKEKISNSNASLPHKKITIKSQQQPSSQHSQQKRKPASKGTSGPQSRNIAEKLKAIPELIGKLKPHGQQQRSQKKPESKPSSRETSRPPPQKVNEVTLILHKPSSATKMGQRKRGSPRSPRQKQKNKSLNAEKSRSQPSETKLGLRSPQVSNRRQPKKKHKPTSINSSQPQARKRPKQKEPSREQTQPMALKERPPLLINRKKKKQNPSALKKSQSSKTLKHDGKLTKKIKVTPSSESHVRPHSSKQSSRSQRLTEHRGRRQNQRPTQEKTQTTEQGKKALRHQNPKRHKVQTTPHEGSSEKSHSQDRRPLSKQKQQRRQHTIQRKTKTSSQQLLMLKSQNLERGPTLQGRQQQQRHPTTEQVKQKHIFQRKAPTTLIQRNKQTRVQPKQTKSSSSLQPKSPSTSQTRKKLPKDQQQSQGRSLIQSVPKPTSTTNPNTPQMGERDHFVKFIFDRLEYQARSLTPRKERGNGDRVGNRTQSQRH